MPLTSCPACGAEVSETVDVGEGALLRRCAECDTVYAPEYATPDEIYRDGYMLDSESPFGCHWDVLHPRFQEFLAHVQRARLRLIHQVTSPPGKLVDIGCGLGEFLVAARDVGWDVIGTDPLEDQAEFARRERGLDVRAALLEDSGLPEGSFDVLTAQHVLEHVPDSAGFLESVARWVRPGGVVAIEVPNFDSVQRKVERSTWRGLRPLEHIVHFTPETLAHAFRVAGLEPVSVTSPSWLGPPQTLDEAIADLSKPALRRWFVPLSRKRADEEGNEALYPTAPAWKILKAAEAAYDRRGVGAVVFGIARVS